jgi:NitT/TauT family transport system ATP-binding protein
MLQKTETLDRRAGPRADPAAPLVSLRGVSKVFSNGTVALQDLSLDIRHGEFVSLLGPSGCGKSTVLRIIAGLGEPTSGAIVWPDRNGRAGADYDLAARDIGFVFQEPTLMPWATVFGNVWLPLRLNGISKTAAREKVMEALAMVGLEKFADAYPRELSGGMKMRVSIARAVITRPKLLLMDEPFAALDEITRFKLNNDLLRLWQTFGWTVVFVTHSVFESVYLSSRIVVMAARPGRVSAELGVDAPYPRTDEFRTSTPYNEHCRRASAALHDAMETRR